MEQQAHPALASRALVLFSAAGEVLAAPSEEVAGMMDADRLAPLPGWGPPMAGVVAFRGSVVPTLDLAAALGAEEGTAAPRYAVVLERGTDRFALLVRGMPKLVYARDVVQRYQAPPDDGAPGSEARGAAAPGDPPVVLAIYEIGGREARYLDYWSLMDSVAPPAAFRLGGLGDR